MVINILLIPAMSSKTERVFSGTNLMISLTRNQLGDDIIKATECLNRWYKADL
jgi:hAT family C-terminal dimerisation region